MERAGHVYSRLSNPTCAVLEERIAALEGGIGAIATASGQAALHLAIVTLLSARIAHRRVALALRRLAQSARLHAAALRHRHDVRRSARPRRLARRDPAADAAAVRRDARQSGTRRARHSARRRARARPRPAAARRFDVHDALADAAVRRTAPISCTTRRRSSCPATASSSAACWSIRARSTGRADGARDKFPTLTAPYAGFHDMVFAEESTTGAFLLRARREGVRDFGACMAPMTAFQILQGIETLPVRMARHVENTRKIVAFLREHPFVADDRLSGAARASRSRARAAAAAARLRRGVQLQPARARASRARRFIEALRLFSHLANVGDAKSLVIHPASTTHFRMSRRRSAARGHHRGHDPAVDRPRGPVGPDRGLGRALYAAGKG